MFGVTQRRQAVSHLRALLQCRGIKSSVATRVSDYAILKVEGIFSVAASVAYLCSCCRRTQFIFVAMWLSKNNFTSCEIWLLKRLNTMGELSSRKTVLNAGLAFRRLSSVDCIFQRQLAVYSFIYVFSLCAIDQFNELRFHSNDGKKRSVSLKICSQTL